MTLHTYTCEQRSEEWLRLRCGLVTASTVGALLTPTLKVADNDTSRAAVAAIVAERLVGLTDPSYTNDDMFRGIEEEPRARDKYVEHYGVEVREVGFITEDKWGFTIGLSPDGLVGDDGLIEIKAPRAKGHIQTVLADAVPVAHMAQIQTALLVSGRQWCDFISWFGGLPMFTKRVEPDPAWQTAIVNAVEAFENNAAQTLARFNEATKGLPTTERLDLELVI